VLPCERIGLMNHSMVQKKNSGHCTRVENSLIEFSPSGFKLLIRTGRWRQIKAGAILVKL
jgi:hypothetical protein